jgi:hypothetical protein
MADDYVLETSLRERMANLSVEEQFILLRCLEEITADPEPDGMTRRAIAPFYPYPPGHMLAECDK